MGIIQRDRLTPPVGSDSWLLSQLGVLGSSKDQRRLLVTALGGVALVILVLMVRPRHNEGAWRGAEGSRRLVRSGRASRAVGRHRRPSARFW